MTSSKAQPVRRKAVARKKRGLTRKKATRRGRKFKFPTPGQVAMGTQAVFCTAEKVLSLFNQDSGQSRARMCDAVREWFSDEARKRGFAGASFITEFQSRHGAGCILWTPPPQVNVQVTVTNHVLVLRDETADDEQ